MAALQYESMTMPQKAAVLVVALGTDTAPKILRELSENEIERLTLEFANLRDIPPSIEARVLKETSEIIMAQQYITQGGVDYARRLLEKAIGKDKTSEILRKLEGCPLKNPLFKLCLVSLLSLNCSPLSQGIH